MAYFCRLDSNNIVVQIIAVDNEDVVDDNGVEQESIGIQFCKDLLGQDTNWVQTSFNASFRKNYAGNGYKYDSTRDAFIAPQPDASWVLNETTCQWESPIPYPDDEDNRYMWDEDAYQADTSDPKTAGWVVITL